MWHGLTALVSPFGCAPVVMLILERALVECTGAVLSLNTQSINRLLMVQNPAFWAV